MKIVFATKAFLTPKPMMSSLEAEQQELLIVYLKSKASLSEYHLCHFLCPDPDIFVARQGQSSDAVMAIEEVRAAVEVGLGECKNLKRQQAAPRRSLLTVKISLPSSRRELGRTSRRSLNNPKSTFEARVLQEPAYSSAEL